MTVVTSEVPAAEASRQGVVEVAGDGRLSGFHDKPEEPPTTRVATEVFAFRTDRLLGTLDHMDLLDPERPLDLDDPDWPVLGRAPHRLPARVEGSARLEEALLSPGAVVAGQVTRSVLGPGVVVEPGATVRDAVLLDDCVVAAGARVERAVLDRGVRVGPDAVVGGPGGDGPALVAEEAQVPPGARVPRGGRFAPDGPNEAT
jgi:glucose-1-phosphate adenylyltransferase